MGLKYFSVLFAFGLATIVMFFSIGYIAYTISPIGTLIIMACLGIRRLASNLAITILEEIKKQGYKKGEK